MKHCSRILLALSTALLCWLCAASCRKTSTLDQGGAIRFSTDTLSFDTVFTSATSFTLPVKIYNPQDQEVVLSQVRLENTDAGFFRLNVDGKAGERVSNVRIAGHDSIYVFATVRIDPTAENNPFIVENRIVATLNGQDFFLPMYAYGQNAYYIDGARIPTATLLTDKPYVIIHSALVDSNATLTIPPGCRIYMHADSRLLVQGRIIARGTKRDSIIFQGDRLDRGYFGNQGYPGEWGGLYFFESSTGNQLEWVVLKNGGNGALGAPPALIQVTGNDAVASSQLNLSNCVLQNSIGYGLLAFHAQVQASNCLFNTTGTQALALFEGGNYTFDNCDFVNDRPVLVSHTDNPTVAALNYFDTGDGPNDYRNADLQARFTNCLIYGSLEEELLSLRKGTKGFSVTCDHCLIKSTRTTDAIATETVFQNCLFNTDPKFINSQQFNFRALDATSPLVDAGVGNGSGPADLDNTPRLKRTAVDIGCYEF